MRQVKITRNYLKHPEGSVLIELGNTKVICTASVENSVPQFLKDSNQGWVTAEYGMLPRSTGTRNRRESSAGKISGRTAEIQRLIGRSLRSVSDLSQFPGYSVLIDCDVIQADGGTRTAAITGACVALYDAFEYMLRQGLVDKNPLVEWAAAISVGIVDGKPYLDLDYISDSSAETDVNVVMTESGKYIEIQGTAEKKPFTVEQLSTMLKLAESGIAELIKLQKQIAEL